MSAVVLTGCASQGPLRPPSLHIPAAVTVASAQRVGPAVEIHWTTPTRTTDGGDLRDRHEHALPLTAELCRGAGTICTPVAHVAVVPGQSGSFVDALPADLTTGQPALLRYRLRILNRNGRSADARELLAAAGAAPPPLRKLTVAAAPLGASLGWQAEQPSPGDFILLKVPPQTATPGAPSAPASAGPDKDKTRVTTLRVDLTSRDPGGAIDSEGKPGDTYTAVRSRPLPGAPADTPVTLESSPATVTLSASALPPPPVTPVGLATVPGTVGGTPRIDLSWQPDTAAVRYIVLRSEAGGPQQQMTPTPIPAISFTDTTVRPGLYYSYSVIAIDSHGTRSNESIPATETAPAP